MIFGTIHNAGKMLEMVQKWEQKKASGNILKKEEKELTPQERQLQMYQEQLKKTQEGNEYSALYAKIQSGEELSPEEEEKLRARDPKLYMEYKADRMEQEAYEKRLKNCKTKEEAERLQVNQLNGKLTELKSIVNNPNISKSEKLKAAQRILGDTNRTVKVYHVYTKSAEFKELPTEEEVLQSKRAEREMLDEEIRDEETHDTSNLYEGEKQEESEENSSKIGPNNAKSRVNMSESEVQKHVSETEQKILEEMYALEEKHFGKSKKSVQIDIGI